MDVRGIKKWLIIWLCSLHDSSSLSRGNRGCQMPGKWRQKRLESRYVAFCMSSLSHHFVWCQYCMIMYVVILKSSCMLSLCMSSLLRHYVCLYYVIMYDVVIITSLCISSLSRHNLRRHYQISCYFVSIASSCMFSLSISPLSLYYVCFRYPQSHNCTEIVCQNNKISSRRSKKGRSQKKTCRKE